MDVRDLFFAHQSGRACWQKRQCLSCAPPAHRSCVHPPAHTAQVWCPREGEGEEEFAGAPASAPGSCDARSGTGSCTSAPAAPRRRRRRPGTTSTSGPRPHLHRSWSFQLVGASHLRPSYTTIMHISACHDGDVLLPRRTAWSWPRINLMTDRGPFETCRPNLPLVRFMHTMRRHRRFPTHGDPSEWRRGPDPPSLRFDARRGREASGNAGR